jgi:membrane protein involved in colicin uptake
MTPVRDDGGRSMRQHDMTSEKDDDFLNEMAEPETDEGDTPEPEAVEVEKGEPETAEVPEVTPTPEPAKEATTVPLASLKAEREKRQKAEAERQRLEAELAALRQMPQQPEPSIDFYADPEGYVQTVISKAQQEANRRLYAVLDAEAREAFPDYDEVMEDLVPKVQANPALKQQIFNSPNPAKAAYQLAKQLKTMESMQDPIAYEAQMRARIKAELEAELKAKADAATAAARAIPPDLANNRSAANKGAQIDGDPFRELFPN